VATLKEARKWWELAIELSQHAPSMHALAMAYLNRTGIVLRYGGGSVNTGTHDNLVRCTELLVKAARQGHSPSVEYLYAAQPLTFSSPQDFEPRELPPFAFSDTMVGRRVEIVGLRRKLEQTNASSSRSSSSNRQNKGGSRDEHELNGVCGTVVEVKPAAGKLEVELDDGRLLSFPRRNLRRPFLAALDESLAKKPKGSTPDTVDYALDPSMPMGLEAEFDTLCVSKVLPQGQAWEAGMRPGTTIVAVAGVSVKDLDAAAEAYEEARARGEESCAVTCLVEEGDWRIF